MRRVAWVLVLGSACSGGGLASSGASSAGNSSCAPGSESCPCYPNETCDGTLRCVSHVCVDLGGGGASGGGNAAAGATASGGASGNGPAPTGGTSVTTGGRPSGGTASGGAPSGGSTAGGCTAPAFFPDGQCGNTADGTAIAKNVACTTDDQQLCDKNCGPGNSGYKTETCKGGLYVEGECAFPANCNFSCFQVPTADAAGCPAAPPQHNSDCNLAICSLPCNQNTPCEMCGVAQGYLDSSGAAKVGYCICIANTTGGGKFACATYPTTWPCPAGEGC